MGEAKSFFRKHWEGYKEFWGERFSFLDNYSRFIYSEKPMPHWDSSVVEEFIASDPVHGPTVCSPIPHCSVIPVEFCVICLCINSLMMRF